MDEVDSAKFNRYTRQGENLHAKIKKLNIKEIKIFEEITRCTNEIIALNEKQSELLKFSNFKIGKKICAQKKCGKILDDENYKRCKRCRIRNNFYILKYRVNNPQDSRYSQEQYERTKAAANI